MYKKKYDKPPAACRQYIVCVCVTGTEMYFWTGSVVWVVWLYKQKTLFLTWLQNMYIVLRLHIYYINIYI